jgi:hypothetical protein
VLDSNSSSRRSLAKLTRGLRLRFFCVAWLCSAAGCCLSSVEGTEADTGTTGGTTGTTGGTSSGTSGSTTGTSGSIGSPCYNDTDCPGATCAFTDPCPGKCVPYLTEGEMCGWLSDGSGPTGGCAPGFYCDPRALACLADPLPDAGSYVDAGAFCSIFGPSCNPGLFCMGIFPDNGVCSPIVGEGGPCPPGDAANGCDQGLICKGFGFEPDGGTCLPPMDAGGPCLVGADGDGSSGCLWGLVCLGGICQVPPSSGPCLPPPEVFECDLATSFCDSSTNSCVPKLAQGGACTGDLECASSLCDLTLHCGTTLCPVP